MSTQTVMRKDYGAARESMDDERTSLLSFPVLDARPRRGRSLASVSGARHPFWTYVCGVIAALSAMVLVSRAAQGSAPK